MKKIVFALLALMAACSEGPAVGSQPDAAVVVAPAPAVVTPVDAAAPVSLPVVDGGASPLAPASQAATQPAVAVPPTVVMPASK